MTRTTITVGAALALLLFTGCTVQQPLERRTASSWAVPVSQGPVGLRVMSFNLRRPVPTDLLNSWGFRKDAAVRAIELVDPDVLGTQEAVASSVRFLESRLPGYATVAAGRSDGESAGEMTAVFYKADRFTLLDHGHFWFSEQPGEPGTRAWGAWWPRMCTWVKLRDDRTGQAFFAFNAHLSSASARAREHSAELLRDRIARVAGDAPVVVLGDFNTDAGTGPHATLTQGGTLNDTHEAVFPGRHDDENTRHRFLGYTRGERIDWVLASPDLTVVTAGILNQKINGRWVSDHFPVAAELVLPDEPVPVLAGVRFNGDAFDPAR